MLIRFGSLELCGNSVYCRNGKSGPNPVSSAWKGWKGAGALLSLAKPQPSSHELHLQASYQSWASLKNHSTRSRTSEKKPFLVILMWECGGFVALPGWLMNPDMKKYWIKCWPSSAAPSLANFLSGSLALYSFLHNGPAKAKGMQRIIQDGCHPGSYEFKPLQSEDGVGTCILFQDKCAAMQATALAFHPAFPPFIPPSFCRMPALVVHSGS